MEKHSVTKAFNVVLFLYLLFASLLGYLFDPEFHREVPWDEVYEWSPIFAIITAILAGLLLIFFWAAIVRIFWNRFLADVFKIRTITYDEAFAVSLMLAIVLF